MGAGEVTVVPADTAAALRSVPVLAEVRIWVVATVEVVAAPAVTAVLGPATPGVVVDMVGQEAESRVAAKTRAVGLAEVVVAVESVL